VEEGLDSFISHKPALPNLDRIREVRLEKHLEEQRERRLLVEQLLANYNEGRSMSFYCVACALMPPDLVRQAIDEMERALANQQVDGSSLKAKAKAMRTTIQNLASQAGIDLKLRKKPCTSLLRPARTFLSGHGFPISSAKGWRMPCTSGGSWPGCTA
jgi:hypothetical protein